MGTSCALLRRPRVAAVAQAAALCLWLCSALQPASGLLMVGTQAVVFSETELLEALRDPSIDIVSLATQNLNLSSSVWPRQVVDIKRRVRIETWWVSLGTYIVNATQAAVGAIDCWHPECHIILDGQGNLEWWNPAVPGNPVTDFLTPVPLALASRVDGNLTVKDVAVISASPSGLWNSSHILNQDLSPWAGNLSISCLSASEMTLNWSSPHELRHVFLQPNDSAVYTGNINMTNVRMILDPELVCSPRYTSAVCQDVSTVCSGLHSVTPGVGLPAGTCAAANLGAACKPVTLPPPLIGGLPPAIDGAPPPLDSSDHAGVPPWVGLAVGLGVGIPLVVAAAAGAVICKRRRRRTLSGNTDDTHAPFGIAKFWTGSAGKAGSSPRNSGDGGVKENTGCSSVSAQGSVVIRVDHSGDNTPVPSCTSVGPDAAGNAGPVVSASACPQSPVARIPPGSAPAGATNGVVTSSLTVVALLGDHTSQASAMPKGDQGRGTWDVNGSRASDSAGGGSLQGLQVGPAPPRIDHPMPGSAQDVSVTRAASVAHASSGTGLLAHVRALSARHGFDQAAALAVGDTSQPGTGQHAWHQPGIRPADGNTGFSYPSGAHEGMLDSGWADSSMQPPAPGSSGTAGGDARGADASGGVVIDLVPSNGSLTLARNPLGVTLLKMLGVGSSGAVYEGTWRGQRVAVKVMKQQVSEQVDLDAILQFKEASLGAELNHPHLLRSLAHALVIPEGLCTDDGVLLRHGTVEAHILSTLCDLGTLKAWLQQAVAFSTAAARRSLLTATALLHANTITSFVTQPPVTASTDVDRSSLPSLADSAPGRVEPGPEPGSALQQLTMNVSSADRGPAPGTHPGSPAVASSQAALGSTTAAEVPYVYPPLACMSPAGAGQPRVHTHFTAHFIAVVDTLLEVADGLRYLLSKGVVHGDLKPQNCLRCSDANALRGFTVKIADFGISRVIHGSRSHTTVTSPPGTLVYFAPELLSSCRLSPACDLYSFGIIMHELLACRQPLATLTMAQVLYRKAVGKLDDMLQYPPATPPAFVDLARACYSLEAGARPSLQHVCNTLLAVREQALGSWPLALPVAPPPPPPFSGTLSSVDFTAHSNERVSDPLQAHSELPSQEEVQH